MLAGTASSFIATQRQAMLRSQAISSQGTTAAILHGSNQSASKCKQHHEDDERNATEVSNLGKVLRTMQLQKKGKDKTAAHIQTIR